MTDGRKWSQDPKRWRQSCSGAISKRLSCLLLNSRVHSEQPESCVRIYHIPNKFNSSKAGLELKPGLWSHHEVAIPEKLKKAYPTLPIFRTASFTMEPIGHYAGDTAQGPASTHFWWGIGYHLICVCLGATFLSEVIGPVDSSGCFVRIQAGFLPIRCDDVPVLLERWEVRTDHLKLKEAIPGVRYRQNNGRIAQRKPVLPWGAVVFGTELEEQQRVQVGKFYLPICLPDGTQVLSRALQLEQPCPVHERTVRFCLLARQGEYFLTGTFTNNWQSAIPLAPAPLHPALARHLRQKQLYYIDVPVMDLGMANFKFRRFDKGYIYNAMEWECEGTDSNRTSNIHHDVAPDARIFMSYGHPEATEDDVLDFLRVAVWPNALQDFDLAVRKVMEVEQSLLQVRSERSYQNPHAEGTVRRALSELLCLSVCPKPCSGLYFWIAVLHHRATGSLQQLQKVLKDELLSAIAAWPAEVISHPSLANDVLAVFLAAVREEGQVSPRLSQQWLQATIQLILHAKVPAEESNALTVFAERVEGCIFPEWGTIQLQGVPIARVEVALRVALRPGYCQQVWFGAMRFLQQCPYAELFGSVCALVALDESLGHPERGCRNWEAIVSQLQCFLDKLGVGRVDIELQGKLTAIMAEAWTRSAGMRHRIPKLGTISVSMVMLAKALTAEPERAHFVEFEDSCELEWLRLAAAISYDQHALASVSSRLSSAITVI